MWGPQSPKFWTLAGGFGFRILDFEPNFEDCARRPGSADNQFTNHLLNSWDIQVCDLLRKDLNESKKDVAGFCFAAANDIFDENRNLSPVFDICCSSGLRGRKDFHCWIPQVYPSCLEVITYHNSMDQNLHFSMGCWGPRVCTKGLFPIGLMDRLLDKNVWTSPFPSM